MNSAPSSFAPVARPVGRGHSPWARPALALAALSLLVACGEADTDEMEEANGPGITLQASLVTDDNGQLPFMTPGASAVRIAPEDVLDKPYYMAVFEAPFAPGVDPALEYKWGRIGEDMSASFTTTTELRNGPYDVVFVLYTVTEITDEQYGTEAAAAAINGDLATFTISNDDVLDGDPRITAGVLRVNYTGQDTTKLAENRWTDDLSDTEAGSRAFTDTILLVP
jgi:hypothetical protein